MRFATEGVLIQHGAEGQVMAALALLAGIPKKSFEKGLPKPEDLLAGAGLDKAGILPALEEIKENKNSLSLLTIPPGRNCQSEQWARTVGLLAAATKSKVLPLLTYGGSAGGLAVSQALELSSPATWWEAARQGVFSTVLIAGADPVGMLPKENVEPALEKIGCVIAASAMPSATTRRADIILPMSFWFEMEGKLIDYQGNSLTMRALAKPPGAAISLVSLVNVLAEKMEVDRVKPVQINWSEVFNKIGNARTSALPVPSPPLEESEEVFVLTSRTENLDLYEGPLSRQLDWVLSLEPIPTVWFNPGDASRMKLRERDEVRISRNGTSITLSARTNHAVPRHTAAVSATLAETRDLWTWQCEETGPTSGPALVTVSPTTVE